MMRFLLAPALLLSATLPALAQDMPLSQILIDGEGWKKADGNKPAKPDVPPLGGLVGGKGVVLHTTYSPDRGTMFSFSRGDRFLRAQPVKGTIQWHWPGAPYAPLRLEDGANTSDVSGLATDRDGRIYAATELGVQVFDPTGRLCGVMTPAAPGKPEYMAFEGDKLTIWVGNTKYARKLNTQEVK